jgi:two-component system response regulator MprA
VVPRVLVVEDDRRIAAFLDRTLTVTGYRVQVASEGQLGLDLATESTPDLVILDLMLPDVDGLEVARQLRARSGVPILMLTARSGIGDRVEGLDAGADDYLVKPFALDELLARVRSLLRRLTVNADVNRRGMLAYADVILDQDTRDATRAGRRLHLRNREFELLAYFLRNPERAISRRELRLAVWGEDFPGESNVIDVTLGHLRQKLELDGSSRLIHTVRPVGYMLRCTPDPSSES